MTQVPEKVRESSGTGPRGEDPTRAGFKHKGSFWKAHHFWGVEEQVQPGLWDSWTSGREAGGWESLRQASLISRGATSFLSLVQTGSPALLSKRPRVAHTYLKV